MSKSKEYGEQLYDAAVPTAGAIGISFASRKLTKETFGLSAIGVKALKNKDLIPDNPFKKS